MRAVRRGAALLLTLLVAGACVTAAAYWHAGYRAYAVRTGSMVPTIPVGALVIDAPVSRDLPRVGDVITFYTPTGPITHRVNAISSGLTETKGDANRTPDAWKVQSSRVIGHVIRVFPHVGYALVFLKQPTGVPSLVLFALAAILAWSLFFPVQPTVGQPTTVDLRTDDEQAAARAVAGDPALAAPAAQPRRPAFPAR